MKLTALMALRNEAWIVGLSARVALKWCDSLVCLLHASTDRTADIMRDIEEEHPGRVTILEETDRTWKEMNHRQRMLMEARRQGATHLAVVDADEVLTGNLLPIVRQRIELLKPGQYLRAGMPCMWRGLDRYRTDGSTWAGRDDLMLAFRDDLARLSWRPMNGYDHHHRSPIGSVPTPRPLLPGGVMHLQWASWRRLLAKHAWYQMHERLRYPNKPCQAIARQYSLAPNEAGLETEQAPAAWWEPYERLLHHVDLQAEPWHEEECRRLLKAHGAAAFRGLNLHGVDHESLLRCG